MKYFAVIGNPISHSKSPLIHNISFQTLNEKSIYGRYHLCNGKELRDKILSLGLNGANITVPFKEDAYLACDDVVGIANEIKAVNTIVVDSGRLIGYNTDGIGFLESVKDWDLEKILILGAGGTAKSIYYTLKDYDVTVCNRSKSKLAEFQKSCSFDDFIFDDYTTIINTTSAGMMDSLLPLPQELLDSLNPKYLYDVIYNVETPIIKWGKSRCEVRNGRDMLIYQAFFAFKMFYGKSFDEDLILKKMKSLF